MLSVGSCFSGIGGLELGLEWTGGFKTKWQIEQDDYASRVLAKHWPSVKRYNDIRDVVRPEPVDLICGGFPCQDVSLAGQRAGLSGKRSTLWGEMHRLICEVKPRWVLAENVPGLLSSDAGRFFGNILRDLATAGYDAEWGVLSAAGMGAPHLRRRIFILGYANLHGRDGTKDGQGHREGANADSEGSDKLRQLKRSSGKGATHDPDAGLLRSPEHEIQTARAEQLGQEVADAKHRKPGSRKEAGGTRLQSSRRGGEWSVEPDVGRVAHGVPRRVDRLKCLGNAVVPQCAQRIGEMILTFESKKGGT